MSETIEKGIVDTYLDKKYINKHSKQSQKSYYLLFIKSIFQKDEWTINNINKGMERYLSEKRNLLNDIINCIHWMHNVRLAPATINKTVNATRLFFRKHGYKIDNDDWKDSLNAILPINQSITQDKILKPNQLRDIINNMGATGRPLALLLLSTGLRIGACIDLKIDDLYLDHDPPYVNLKRLRALYIKNRKKLVPPFVCMTYECANELKHWLIIKQTRTKPGPEHKQFAKKNEKLGKRKRIPFPKEMVFGYTKSNFQGMWRAVLIKMGLAEKDPNTGYKIYHVHTLRKFFSTMMMEDHAPNDLVDAWLGHQKYLATYDKRGEQWMMNEYKKHMHAVTVREGSNTKLLLELEQKTKENKQLRNIVTTIMTLAQSQGIDKEMLINLIKSTGEPI